MAAETKIVIVAGQEFSVPADAKVEDLRTHLTSMFPDVASATVQKGKRTIDGVEYETVEFVKKAGTKGATGEDIVAVLRAIPALRLAPPPADAAALLARVVAGQATIQDALGGDVTATIAALPKPVMNTGGALCSQLDGLTPVTGRGPSAW
jgi:hypothetical protein